MDLKYVTVTPGQYFSYFQLPIKIVWVLGVTFTGFDDRKARVLLLELQDLLLELHKVV